jgi:gas vesicle protein
MSNSTENSNYTKGLVVGALIGGAVGAVVALLFAPKSGVELRREIAETSSDVYNKAYDYFSKVEDNVGTMVGNTVNEGKLRAEKIVNSAKRQAENLISNAENVLQEAKNKAYNLKDNVQEKIGNIRDAAKAGAEAFKTELNTSPEQQ